MSIPFLPFTKGCFPNYIHFKGLSSGVLFKWLQYVKPVLLEGIADKQKLVANKAFKQFWKELILKSLNGFFYLYKSNGRGAENENQTIGIACIFFTSKGVQLLQTLSTSIGLIIS
ncbi:hypothetical protein [Bacillus chungangensis]|uniref:Uncharacterized protein n=1 Tax=Bacillus chungangensis TaxID=587633 RepID=A0ABT9WX47_9BACI|nr:hypothetical protein [Bacillus chungangensis]MDQ0177800.1 hypothetical protein [Bacillus chungangensis]